MAADFNGWASVPPAPIAIEIGWECSCGRAISERSRILALKLKRLKATSTSAAGVARVRRMVKKSSLRCMVVAGFIIFI